MPQGASSLTHRTWEMMERTPRAEGGHCPPPGGDRQQPHLGKRLGPPSLGLCRLTAQA